MLDSLPTNNTGRAAVCRSCPFLNKCENLNSEARHPVLNSPGDGLARRIPCMGRLKHPRRLFISFAKEDDWYALMIKTVFDQPGSKVVAFKAPESIVAGESFGAALTSNIRHSDVFVLLYSEATRRSRWVPDEVLMARDAGVHIVPLLLDSVRFDDGFALNFQSLQTFMMHKTLFLERISEARAIILDILIQQEERCWCLFKPPEQPKSRWPFPWFFRGRAQS